MKVCSVDGCGGKVIARGWCGKHYARWRRHGTPLPDIQERTYNHPEICTIEGCDRPYRARGMCATHHQRWRMNGDPHIVLPPNPPTREKHYAWKSDDVVDYMTIHWRLHRRGPAKDEPCSHCNDSAYDWAYDHSDPNEKTSPEGYPYSTDLDRYFPLCRPCHKRFDQNRDAPNPLDEARIA